MAVTSLWGAVRRPLLPAQDGLTGLLTIRATFRVRRGEGRARHDARAGIFATTRVRLGRAVIGEPRGRTPKATPVPRRGLARDEAAAPLSKEDLRAENALAAPVRRSSEKWFPARIPWSTIALVIVATLAVGVTARRSRGRWFGRGDTGRDFRPVGRGRPGWREGIRRRFPVKPGEHRRHIVAWRYIRNLSRFFDENILRLLGYDPARYKGGVEEARRAWALDRFNDPANFWRGIGWVNSWLGRMMRFWEPFNWDFPSEDEARAEAERRDREERERREHEERERREREERERREREERERREREDRERREREEREERERQERQERDRQRERERDRARGR